MFDFECLFLFRFGIFFYCIQTVYRTAPVNVSKIIVNVFGGQGFPYQVHTGGLGGWVAATLLVTPGQILAIMVGGGGTYTYGGTANNWNGGGLANGGWGGGASDIRTSVNDLKTRLVVAGGGGEAYQFGNGGAGGKSSLEIIAAIAVN